MDLTAAVFSYNRGDYLANCAASVLRHMAGATFRIHDDASDDPRTRAVLAGLAPHLAAPGTGLQSKHGGLYANMQAALDGCATRFLLFLQDDMQVVRPVTAQDMDEIAAIFDADPARAFLCPTFVKGLRLSHAAAMRPLLPLRAWAGSHAYGDVCIADAPRLRAAGWRFAARERLSQDQAARMFAPMPYMATPFCHFLPEVPVFRARRTSLAARLARRITGPGVKAFDDLTEAEITALRASTALPVAEDWLRTVWPAARPFVYQDIRVRRWIATLHRVETALRKGRG